MCIRFANCLTKGFLLYCIWVTIAANIITLSIPETKKPLILPLIPFRIVSFPAYKPVRIFVTRYNNQETHPFLFSDVTVRIVRCIFLPLTRNYKIVGGLNKSPIFDSKFIHL
jgi:hypothetical protein